MLEYTLNLGESVNFTELETTTKGIIIPLSSLTLEGDYTIVGSIVCSNPNYYLTISGDSVIAATSVVQPVTWNFTAQAGKIISLSVSPMTELTCYNLTLLRIK